MASIVTLQQLRDGARAKSDMQNSGFIQDTELDAYINASAQELYDLLTTKFEDYYITTSNFVLTPPAVSVAVPADFYKLRGVDFALGGGLYATVYQFNFQDRNRLGNPLLGPIFETAQARYRLRGGFIDFISNQSMAFNGRLWYVPAMPKLVSASDTFDGVNGWEEYILIDAAMKMLQKEESDVSVLMAQKKALITRIENTAANRDAGMPERVADVNNWAEYWGPYRRF